MAKKSVNRLNQKQHANKTGLILGCTAALWVFLMLDMLFIAHNNWFIIVAVSIGVWAVGLTISKPGEFAEQVQRVGFWKALLGNGTNQDGGRHRRR